LSNDKPSNGQPDKKYNKPLYFKDNNNLFINL
jgi:hypothetical protein